MTSIYQIPLKGANVWAKLESENPTGTHKDRSIGPWIERYVKQGVKEFAIASSGNSALAAARYCKISKLKLHIFVSENSFALARLKKGRAELHIGKTPRRDAIQFCARKKDIINLRASTDNYALLGYKQIAYELVKQLPRMDNIFIPTSSGATLQGVYAGFKEKTDKMPAFYAVQTTRVHPIASYFDKDFKREKTSYAAAIVDNIAHRRDRVIKICEETGGGGLVISNQELAEAKDALEETGWPCHAPSGAWQSALAFAGFLKWQKRSQQKAGGGVSVCLFTD